MEGLGNEPALAPAPSLGAMLCAAPTSFGNNSALNRRPECEPIYNAPFTEADVEPLVRMTTQCPLDDLTTRIFQQHSKGQTCWHDAFFMLSFHANPLKEATEEHARLFLRTLLELGYKDLAYAEGYDSLHVKPSAVARVFKEKYADLPLQFWEMYCLALQRFLLLNYLFLKDAESRGKRSLFQRRKSISENEFTRLHSDFKGMALFAKGPGLWCYNVPKLKQSVSAFIKAGTAGKYEMLPIMTPAKELRDIQGYYIWQEMTHVFCLFRCGEDWFVFDNEVGAAPFSKADSEKLSSVAIRSMKVGDSEEHADKVQYKFILADETEVATLVPKLAESAEKTIPIRYGKINPSSSFVLARRTADGGGKKTRRRRKRGTRRR
jgi:hypothetical protein